MGGNPDLYVYYFMMTPDQHAAYATYLGIPEENETTFQRLGDGNFYAVFDSDLEGELLTFDSVDGLWGNNYTADYWTISTVPGVFRP